MTQGTDQPSNQSKTEVSTSQPGPTSIVPKKRLGDFTLEEQKAVFEEAKECDDLNLLALKHITYESVIKKILSRLKEKPKHEFWEPTENELAKCLDPISDGRQLRCGYCGVKGKDYSINEMGNLEKIVGATCLYRIFSIKYEKVLYKFLRLF